MGVQTDAFSERIKAVIGEESVRNFAQRAGISEGGLRRYLSGNSEPGLSALKGIAKAGDVNIEWLATGEGAKERGRLADGSSLIMEDCAIYGAPQCEACHESSRISLYDVQPSAGEGTIFNDENIIDHIPFSRKWLKQQGLSEKNLVLVTARGDSMHPTIKNGDMLMLDRTRTEATSGVYIIRMGDELFVKRLQKNPVDNSISIKSDNPSYEPIIAQEDQLGRLNIVGKVVWIGTRP